MKLRMVGCSHHQSGAAVRERLAFDENQTARSLASWRELSPDCEGVLLSTCNRVEFYAAAASDRLPPCPGVIARHLAESHHLPLDEVRPHLVTLTDEQAVDHLFRVAASLDSMVLGEPQIASQVKQAYEIAQQVHSTGPMTHGCFQAALHVAKRVASETNLHKHRVSIPSVAITDFAGQIFERFDDKRVLVIGAGEMADETLRYLVDKGASNPVILNRSMERAERVAQHWSGSAVPAERLFEELVAADLVVGAAGGGQIVSSDQYSEQVVPGRAQRPLFILDLAIPRCFDPTIGDQLGVYLYSIDDLTQACERNRRARKRELPVAERIVQQEREQFFVNARHKISAPVIARLRIAKQNHFESVRFVARIERKIDRGR